MREEEHMVKTTSPDRETGEQDKNEDLVERREAEYTDKEEHIDKIVSPPPEVVEQDINDSPQRETKFSFLHSAKLKSDSMLQVDSWIYNEMMGLKKKIEIMQHNQETDHAKISQMEVQMGDQQLPWS